MRHPKVNSTALAEAIRSSLAEKGWTRSELSQRSGANTGQICKILNSEFERASMRIQRICSALGIDWGRFRAQQVIEANELSSEVNAFVKGDPTRERAVVSMLKCFKSLCEGGTDGSISTSERS
jgi:transcriptional regulator with XRE-family HTH domain